MLEWPVQSDQLHPAVRAYHEYAAEWLRQATGGDFDPRGRPRGGVVPIVTSTFRTLDQQRELYENRATNPYPVNRPGDSAHNYGLAVDSDVPDAYMPWWIGMRRYLGFRVPDNDEVHAEVPGWRQIVGL